MNSKVLNFFFRLAATNAQGQGADAPTTRATRTLSSAQSMKAPRRITLPGVKSEPKPKVDDPFLKQALRRGGDRSNAAMLSALVNMKDKDQRIDCEGLAENQKSRLRDT